MTAFIYKRSGSGRRRALRFFTSVAREEVRLACGIYRFRPGRRWAVPKLFIKRRHPGGGGCRHLIEGPPPREEVKHWASRGSDFRQGGISRSVFVLGAVGSLVSDCAD